MRYQVPQFIDIEDKVVGPFTLKQFLMYVFTVLMLVPVFLLSDLSLFITIALPAVGVAVVFAHVKINGKSFATILVSGFRFYTRSQLYLWQRSGNNSPIKIRDERWEELSESRLAAQKELTALTSLAQSLDTGGNAVTAEAIADPFDVLPQQ